MKKKIFIIIGVLLVACAIAYEVVLLLKNDVEPTPGPVEPNEEFIYLGSFYDRIIEEDNYVFTNYEDFASKFQSEVINEDSFNEHNYALITILYDECSEKNVTPTKYRIYGNIIKVDISYTAKCGVCAPQKMYYLLAVDKSITDAEISYDYHANNKVHCDPNVTYKPMIYLYPTHKMKVNVKLGYKDLLTVTYPKYNDGWNVTARTDGKLIGEDGRTYYGLYWEGLNNFDNEFKDGFVVEGKDATSFLEEKLEILGLNEIEANEFIVYWLPKLEENEYNLIRFESIEKINEQMPLEITPAPDTIIRVLMEYKPINYRVNINEQALTRVSRKGFTVVEWGGSLIK